MNSVLGWIVVAALFAPAGHAGEAASRWLKCAAVTGPPVYVLDGKIVTAENMMPPDPETVVSIGLLCSGESDRVYGIEPGRNLAVIWTSAAPPRLVKRSVESIERLQRDYARRYGVFSRNVSDLGWRDRSGSISVRLCVSEDGKRWNALGWQSSPNSGPGVLITGFIGSGTDAASGMGYRCELSQSSPA